MVEQADALDLKFNEGNFVPVQVRSAAPPIVKARLFMAGFYYVSDEFEEKALRIFCAEFWCLSVSKCAYMLSVVEARKGHKFGISLISRELRRLACSRYAPLAAL